MINLTRRFQRSAYFFTSQRQKASRRSDRCAKCLHAVDFFPAASVFRRGKAKSDLGIRAAQHVLTMSARVDPLLDDAFREGTIGVFEDRRSAAAWMAVFHPIPHGAEVERIGVGDVFRIGPRFETDAVNAVGECPLTRIKRVFMGKKSLVGHCGGMALRGVGQVSRDFQRRAALADPKTIGLFGHESGKEVFIEIAMDWGVFGAGRMLIFSHKHGN